MAGDIFQGREEAFQAAIDRATEDLEPGEEATIIACVGPPRCSSTGELSDEDMAGCLSCERVTVTLGGQSKVFYRRAM